MKGAHRTGVWKTARSPEHMAGPFLPGTSAGGTATISDVPNGARTERGLVMTS